MALMKIYYVLDDEHRQLRIHDGKSDRILRDFNASIHVGKADAGRLGTIHDIFTTPDGRLLVYAGREFYIVDDTGATEEIFDGVFDLTGYNPQGILSFMGVNGKSYLLNMSTLSITDVTIAEGEYHEPSMADITNTVIVGTSYSAPKGIIRGKGWEIKTGKTFEENRWFPPYVFLLSKEDIVVLDTRTGEYITLLEKDARGSFMYDSYIHYDDNTLALLGLTANGNPIVRQYSNIPYEATHFVEDTIVTPDQYVFIQKEKGRYEYYNLKDPSVVKTVQLPGKAWRIVTVEDNSMITAMLGDGILASLIGRYL